MELQIRENSQLYNEIYEKHSVAVGLLQIYQTRTIDLLEKIKIAENTEKTSQAALLFTKEQVITDEKIFHSVSVINMMF